MPKINIVIEKELKDMTSEEMSMYVKQLEEENVSLKSKYETDIKALNDAHSKEVERLKSQNYNRLLKDTTRVNNEETSEQLDINEMVS